MAWAEELQEELSRRGLAVVSIPGKGRGLVAVRDFFPGEIIICQEPYAAASNKDSSCDGCFLSSNLRKCSACQITWYCGRTCQRAEWKLHQLECRAIAQLSEARKKMLTPSIRLMVRLVLRRKLQNEQMANLVKLILPSLELDLKEIAHNFSKLACNAHTICDCELRPVGTGLYPVISIINHSCVPNSVLVFEGRIAYVRALQPISKNTEVSISYIETAATTKKRQSDLKQYFFTCTCPRCVKNSCGECQEDAFLEGFRCMDQRCDGVLLPVSALSISVEKKVYTCQKCGLSRDEEDIKEMTNEIILSSDKASSFLSSGKTCEAATVYKTVEQLEQKLYHPFSITLLGTRETLLKICMELQDWRSALTYCKLTIPTYERIYPTFHPMIGLQLYTCGKLEWLLECTEDALKSLTRAADILRVTHGTSSQFMRELLGKLEQARAEASFKLPFGHQQQIGSTFT